MMDVIPSSVLLVIIINTCIALLYMLYGILRGKGNRKKYIMIACILLLTPPIGCIVLVLAHILYQILFSRDIDREAVSFSKERVKIYTLPEEERELNIVPVNETLAVSGKGVQRTLILNVLKDYSEQSLATISDALSSQDSEVSHYAASALLDAISDFRATAQNLLFAMEKNEDIEIKILSFQYINNALLKNFLPEVERKSYIYELNGVLRNMFDQDKEQVLPEFYESMVYFLLQLHDFTSAHIWCDQLALDHTHTLSYYKALLRLYYEEKKYPQFLDMMERLKQSDVKIDGETLDLIRTFTA